MTRTMAFLLIALPAAAWAQGAPPPAAGAGNLPPGFYPRSPCVKPALQGTEKPRDARDGKAVAAYNDKVRAYNQTAAAFNVCVMAYAEKARHDMEEIRAAVADANSH